MSESFRISVGQNNWNYRVQGEQVFLCNEVQNPHSVNLNIESDALRNNVALLLSRQEGQIFRAHNGRLVLVNSLLGRIKYWFHKRDEQAQIQPLVNRALEALNNALKSISSDDRVVVKEFLRSRFLIKRGGNLARLPKEIFNRSAIAYGGALEGFLADQTLLNARMSLKDVLKEHKHNSSSAEAIDAISNADYASRWEETKFANQIGMRFEPVSSGGSGGARFGKTRRSDKIVVLKPGDEGPYGANNPSLFTRLVKQNLLSPRSCLKGNSEPRAEHGSSRLSDALGLQNVPKTRIENVEADFIGASEKECSVQLFVHGAQTMREYLGISSRWNLLPPRFRGFFRRHLQRRHNRNELPELPQVGLEYMAIQKHLSGDIDTHLENMLVKSRVSDEVDHTFLNNYFSGSATDNQIDDFVDQMFKDHNHYYFLDRLHRLSDNYYILNHDGGAGFVNKEPSSSYGPDGYLSSRYRFLFEVHPEFSKPFSAEVREHMLGQQRQMVEFALEHAVRELVGVSGHQGVTYTFHRWWQKPENRRGYKEFLLMPAGTAAGNERLDRLARDLACENLRDLNVEEGQETHKFRRELIRIKGITDSILNRTRLLLHHLTHEQDQPKRVLFTLVHRDQISGKLVEISNTQAVKDFDSVVENLLNTDVGGAVSTEDLPHDYHILQHLAHKRLGDLGVRTAG